MNKTQATVSSVHGLIVRADFEGGQPTVGQLFTLDGQDSVRFQTIGIENSGTLITLNLSETNVKQGEKLISTGKGLELPVGPEILGRVFNCFGETIDNGDVLKKASYIPVSDDTNIQLKPHEDTSLIETGVKVIDFFAPFVRGRKIGIIGGAGVGKTVLTTELMHNVARSNKELSMFVGIGERIREAYELHTTLEEAKLLQNTVMYLGQMNESAALRFMVGRSAATVARHMRDTTKKDVLLFIDNVYRYLQAGNELSTMLDEASSEGGYQPTLFSELSRFEQNLSTSENGAITTVQSIYVPADDMSDPAVVEVNKQLDSVIVLSRDVMEQGIMPAVDMLATSSSLLTKEIVGEAHAELVPQVQAILQKYKSLQGIVAIIGQNELSVEDQKNYQTAQQIIDYFTQPLAVMEKRSGVPGEYVDRSTMLKNVTKIVKGDSTS
jgi:F-type H+-transporting ATPase subunit beta